MRSRNILWRIVLLSLLFYSVFSFVSVTVSLNKTRQTASDLQQRLAVLQAENAGLKAASEQRTDTELQDLARERLGLVLPGEKIFYFTEDRED